MVVFPEMYKNAIELMRTDTTIFIKGKINARDDIPKVLAEDIIPLEDVQKRFTKTVSIDLQTAGLDSVLLKEIKRILVKHKGPVPVYLSFKDPQGKTAVLHSGEDSKVEASDELFNALEKLVGENTVKIH